MKRRNVVKGVAGGVAAAAVPFGIIEAGRDRFGAQDGAGDSADAQAAAAPGGPYSETYKGRTITVSDADDTVHIDGKQLHLMKMGEGAYLSAMCHYRMAPTPLAAGRQAVDELRGANLLPGGGSHHA
ncbi:MULTISPECIES: bagremycin/ferroverdin biosynthesis copper chaperon BagZ/FevE [Streptomyces]|uniref:bagremycin/ferroverdin biosynthesis copper chaperon BagZ/FevE n=1 Tax=Streptomyces TaxID=1883 RepID=UPI000A605A1F|nr:bagremycin/ferroverdin biosynthesis copper chaperon BagZ/FevE [Streptomyces silvensis]